MKDFEYEIVKPNNVLSDFVDSFWMVANHSEQPKDIIILPDGRIDIIFSLLPDGIFKITLMGLENEASKTTFPSKTSIFAISLKPLVIEYLPDLQISDLLNQGRRLPTDFWGFNLKDFHDLECFHNKATNTITTHIKQKIDDRKRKLFALIYASKGELTVQELSDKVYWSSRQINRYFNQQFGLSLKAYCNILRFRASFPHLKEGKLFPQQNYADQAHFIREVKKHAGVVPKELAKNKNDRFIQFLDLPKD